MSIISDMKLTTDFIVIGSGIAGLNAAITLADFGKVTIITKKNIADSSTNIAQGGIAAVTQKGDSISSHEKDTMAAGVFYNNKKAVRFLVKNGKTAIDRLITIGVPFENKTTLEAAHSYPRIHHATDITGHEIEKALVKKISENNNITVSENSYANDLIVKNNTCFGVQMLKGKKIYELFGKCVVLATGGAGQLYLYTTNPSVVTGDGIALAHRGGAKLSDLEFVQFHPTALQEKESPLFLLSEALRGEGAHLIDAKGNQFINELAPRDVVARAIFEKQKKGKVFLDIRHLGKKFIMQRFPNIYQKLKTKGYDLAVDLVPITPAAHFLCGGVVTDTYGHTSVKNLFAYGEVACTGVHGANRLASNSLLEGMVFSSQIKKCIKRMPKKIKTIQTKIPLYVNQTSNHATIKKHIQKLMWQYVGIERAQNGLTLAIQEITKLSKEIQNEAKKGINEKLLEIQNMIETSILIAIAAKNRKKSLGAHFITNN